MATEKQLAANRANARHSTGPKTSEGKAAARFNAVKHGLLAEAALLPDEDPADVEVLREAIHEQLVPRGDLETILADRVVTCTWRLRRVLKVEAGLFIRDQYEEIARRARNRASRYVTSDEQERFAELLPPPTYRVIDEQAHAEAIEQENAATRMLDSEAAHLGGAFARDAAGPDAFTKLSAYEARIERSLYKALVELQRLQDARAHEPSATRPLKRSPGEIATADEEAGSDVEPPACATDTSAGQVVPLPQPEQTGVTSLRPQADESSVSGAA